MSNQMFSTCTILVSLLTIIPFEQSAALPVQDVKGTCVVRSHEMMDPLRMTGPESGIGEFETSFGMPHMFIDGQQYRYRFVNKVKMECYGIEGDIPSYEGDMTLMSQQHNLPYPSSIYGLPQTIDPNLMFICHDCTIPKLTANTTSKLKGTQRYMYIDFGSSKIKEVDANAFVNYSQLSAINLGGNYLKHLPERLFWNQLFPSPLQLGLQNNNFSNISKTLCNVKEFDFLNLQNNKITSMEVDCKIKVNNLNMSNNLISSLNLDFLENYANLRLLDLSFNNLNTLSNIEGPNLDSVKYLLWNHNNFGGIGRRYFRRFTQLQSLVLRNNIINTIDAEALKDLKMLQHLDLSFNVILEIPFGIFRDMEMLKDINLGMNHIQKLTMQSFAGLTELKFLNLSSNWLRRISSTDLLQIKQLQGIDLSNNRLHTLDIKAILSQHTIYWMAIKNNFWNCRQLLQILQYAQERSCNIKRGVLFDVPNIHGIACTSKNLTLTDDIGFDDFLSSLSDEKEMELILSKLDSLPVDETNELEEIVSKIKSLVLLIAVLFVVDFIFQWLFRLYQARHTMNIPISHLK